jgi:hypothetical protein
MLIAGALATLLGAAPFPLVVARITMNGYFEVGEAALLEVAAAELATPQVAVITLAQAKVTLGPERKAALFGCQGPEASCIPPLAEALHAEGVLQGSVSRTPGAGLKVVLRIHGASDGRPLATSSQEGLEESGLEVAVRGAARLLAEDLRSRGQAALSQHPLTHATATDPFLRKLAWGTLAGSGVAFVTGVVLGLNRLGWLAAPKSYTDWPGYLGPLEAEARRLLVISYAAFITGAVALGAFAVFHYLGVTPRPVEPVLTLGPGGASVGFAGYFP